MRMPCAGRVGHAVQPTPEWRLRAVVSTGARWQASCVAGAGVRPRAGYLLAAGADADRDGT